MENLIVLEVTRRLDNRFENLPDDSPRALELHNRRKSALNDVFHNEPILRVTDWGLTNDTKPHEYVELILMVVASKIIEPVIITGLKELGKILAEKAVEETTSQFVKWIISKLVRKQKDNQIANFNLKLQNGISINIEPPQGTSEITVKLENGEMTTIKYQLKDNNK
jgi:hypothetical protein